jgi:hypothetical protein
MQGALHQGRPEVALTFGHSDPSPTLKIEAIRELLWVGQFRDAFEFLEAMPDPDFLKATKHMNEEDLPPSIRSHMIACCRSLVSETVDSKARLRLLLRLAALGDQDISTSLKVELTVLPQQTVKAVSEYSIRPAIEIVIKVDREWVSRFVAERIIDGSLWPDTWLSFVSGMPESSRERLVERVSTEDLRGGANGGIISLLVAIADTTLAKTIFVKLRDHRQELAADPRNAEKQAIDAQLRGLFQFLSAPVAVEGLSDILAEKPDDAELSIITEMFSSMDLSTKG